MDNIVILSIIGMGGLGLFFAAILATASERFKVKEDPKIVKLEETLPGLNCGACGFLSCHDYAVHLAKGESEINLCRPGGEETQKMLAKFLGVEAKETVKKIAVVHCAADISKRKKKAIYSGTQSCRAANIIKGGEVLCDYGCLGFGDCKVACPFDAIEMKDGLPVISIDKCVACGKCVQACPRKIISLEEFSDKSEIVYVACSSHDKGPDTRKACPVGCISCGICVKFSGGAFQLKDFLSVPVYDKVKAIENRDEVMLKCPTKVIKLLTERGK